MTHRTHKPLPRLSAEDIASTEKWLADVKAGKMSQPITKKRSG